MTTRPDIRTLAGAALLMLAVSTLPPASTALTASEVTPPVHIRQVASVGAEGEKRAGKLMLVLDSSGSMAEPADGGQTKIAAARQALRTVIDRLPASAPVGLRVYGAEVFAKSEPGACTDSQRVVDINAFNKSELRAAIGQYRPYGETPIGYSLARAAEDLGDEGPRTIVLVSDGEATCPPPPCEVAKSIAEQGIDIKIDVVGLDVSAQARRQLACIADRGRGTYYDADNADDLVSALDKLSSRAFRPFRLVGERVQGTREPSNAPTLTAGQYVTDMGPDDSYETFVLRRAIPDSTLHAGVNGITPEFTDGVTLSAFPLPLHDSGLDDCGKVVPGFGLGRGDDLFSASITIDPRSFSTEEGCIDDEVLLYLGRGQGERGFGGDEPLDVELVVTEEPPVYSLVGLPGGLLDAPWVAPRVSGPPQRVVGGTSFSDAGTVEEGIVKSDIVPGETLVYRVPVDWGQRAVFRVTFPARGEALADALGYLDVAARVKAYSPSRGEISYNGITGPRTSNALNNNEPLTLGVATPEVRFRNRESPADDVAASAQPGYCYLALSTSSDADGESYTVPFQIEVDVVGKVRGSPEYAGTDQGSPGPTEPTEPTEATPTQPTASPETPAPTPSDGDEDNEASPAGSSRGTTATWLLAVGAGTAGLIALVASVLLLRRPGG